MGERRHVPHIYIPPVFRTYRVHEEYLEVARLDAHRRTPRDLALLHHLHRIDVDQPRSGGQQQHALARKQALALVDEALLQDDLVVDELVPLVVRALRSDALLSLVRGDVEDVCGTERNRVED